jgi:hypothetical protein
MPFTGTDGVPAGAGNFEKVKVKMGNESDGLKKSKTSGNFHGSREWKLRIKSGKMRKKYYSR